ncbi:DNA polymerase I [Escherichia coli]|uniref:DNA polymerase I n=1 Tax=Escherichia coli TaxID=562 RepID=A0A376TYZ9_ECOLX|nr:DNA polymerase I [Escherichia coli]
MLRSLIMQYKPTHAAVVFDAREKPFVMNCLNITNHIGPPMPDDLRAQIEPLHAMVKAMGLPLLAVFWRRSGRRYRYSGARSRKSRASGADQHWR